MELTSSGVNVLGWLQFVVSACVVFLKNGSNVLLNINLDARLAIFVDDLEGEVLDVTLDVLVVELATNETLDIVDGPEGVGGKLVFGWQRRSVGKFRRRKR